MSQAINIRAVRWVYEQDGLRVTSKGVLMTFAMHADNRGYSWPSVERIAFTWGMDRETVRRQIEKLLVRRMIYRTKKRYGSTGQVKVYRLPKITWESSGKSTRLQNEQSGDKAGHKRSISGGKSAPNNGMMEQRTKNHDKGRAVGNSIPSDLVNRIPESVFGFGTHQHQNQPAQSHVKWPEFAAWCRKQRDRRGQPGQPTEAGFWKWLRGQKLQWRNRVKQTPEESGYTLDGKFFTDEQANQMGRENSELLTKFRRAVRRGSKIEHV
jgi:hypothetical protein